jgi:hypothetical protein
MFFFKNVMAMDRNCLKSVAVNGVTRRRYQILERIREFSTVAFPTTDRDQVECI